MARPPISPLVFPSILSRKDTAGMFQDKREKEQEYRKGGSGGFVSLSGWSYPPLNGNSVCRRVTFTTRPWRMELEPRATKRRERKNIHTQAGVSLNSMLRCFYGLQGRARYKRNHSCAPSVPQGSAAGLADLDSLAEQNDSLQTDGGHVQYVHMCGCGSWQWICAGRGCGRPLSASSSLPPKSVQDPSSRVRAPGAPRLEEGLRAGGGRGGSHLLFKHQAFTHTHIVPAVTSAFCVGRTIRGWCGDGEVDSVAEVAPDARSMLGW
ncbi:hypothetical protein C8Q74DRAFT_715093 [Fomes fomentarius]|nr:hypothetical protein C8Q74DRAFT_715093 [Fomes fomentarius]